MNGHFEINNTNYPIGTMRSLGDYRVFDMRSLKPLHDAPVSRALGYEAAAAANAKLCANELPHQADAPEVADFVQAFIADKQGE